ncbi:MAG: DUF444 family protein, partial [Planctomycetes bacterium]|nr:DUF444 family protein [Planctomycetota bacterium]
MAKRIDKDQGRFRKIVSGRLRKDLRKYITNGELVARKRGGQVRIPMPQIQPPRFRFGSNEGGVGQGQGQPGDPVDGQKQPGQGEAGEGAGDHQLEVDVTLEELAALLGEELGLPRIEPKGKKEIETIRSRFTGIRQVGPESLRHFKRTYKEGLKRAIASGTYDAENPIIIPQREDKRYRSWQTTRLPESTAVIMYMMDVSGS